MVNGCLDTIVCFIIVIITELYGPYPINLRLLKDVVIYYPFISIQSLEFNLNVLCMRSRKIVSIRREYRVLVLDIKGNQRSRDHHFQVIYVFYSIVNEWLSTLVISKWIRKWWSWCAWYGLDKEDFEKFLEALYLSLWLDSQIQKITCMDHRYAYALDPTTMWLLTIMIERRNTISHCGSKFFWSSGSIVT